MTAISESEASVLTEPRQTHSEVTPKVLNPNRLEKKILTLKCLPITALVSTD